MYTKVFSLILVVALCVGIMLPVYASQELDRLVDSADLLTVGERLELKNQLDELSEKHSFDIVVVTVDSIGYATSQQYADDFFDYNGYGFGENRDGILLLISMEDRDWCISTSGYGITAFTDSGLEYIENEVVPYLSDGDYNDAFLRFAQLCDEFIIQARKGTPYDTYNLPKGAFEWGSAMVVSLVIGLIAALIVTGVLKGQLKSVRSQSGAANYVESGSMHVTIARDIFLYKNITRREKPRDNGGSGGGSSSHRSSSGRSHGGRSGKF